MPAGKPRTRIARLASRWRHDTETEWELKQCRKIISRFRPEIIHVFGTERSFGLLAGEVQAPLVVHIQGNVTVYARKWFSGLTPFDVLRFGNIRDFVHGVGPFHEYYQFLNVAAREREIFQRCRYFMGRTAWDRRITRILSPKSTYYHCDELLRPAFSRNTWCPHGRGNPILWSTVRNATYKGLETIVEVAGLLQVRAGMKVEWKVAGVTANDAVVRIIERKHRVRMSAKGIALLGAVDELDLLNGLLGADIYVHPSHIDNSPNAVCEAMMLGMPVVSTAAGGIPTIVQDGREGILVQDGDPYSMAGAIQELWSDQDLQEVLGRNARIRALERHDPEQIARRVLEIYVDILQKRTRGYHLPL